MLNILPAETVKTSHRPGDWRELIQSKANWPEGYTHAIVVNIHSQSDLSVKVEYARFFETDLEMSVHLNTLIQTYLSDRVALSAQTWYLADEPHLIRQQQLAG